MTDIIAKPNQGLRVGIDSLYNAFISMLMLMYMLEATSIESFSDGLLHDVLFFCSILIAAFYIILRKYSVSGIFRIGVLNILGMLCYVSSRFTGFFTTMLAITLLPRNKLNSVLKVIFKVEMIAFCGIVLSSAFGFIENTSFAVNKGAYMAAAKALGFAHPNMFAAQATSIVLLYLCIYRNKIRKKHIISAYFFIILIFIISRGRTALILGVVAVTLIAVHEKQSIKKIIMRMLPWMYILVLMIVVICMTLYARLGANSPIVTAINDGLFNGRMGLAYRSLLVYPITLFGKPLDLSIWNEWQYYSLDNGQVMLLLEYGVFGFLGYGWVIQKTLHCIKKGEETVLAIVMITFLIWSIYEGTMYFIGKNIALLFLGASAFNDKQDNMPVK